MTRRTTADGPLTAGFLWRMLPEVMRRRDAEVDGGLGALVHALEEALATQQLAAEAALWDQFVETCAPEELARLAPMVGLASTTPPSRASLALAAAVTRSKGTAVALERAVEAATGWTARLELTPPTLKVWRRGVLPSAGVACAPGDAPRTFWLDPLGRPMPVCRVPPPLELDRLRTPNEVPEPPTADELRVHLVSDAGIRTLDPAEVQLDAAATEPTGAAVVVVHPGDGRVRLRAGVPAQSIVFEGGVVQRVAGATPGWRPQVPSSGTWRERVSGGGAQLEDALRRWERADEAGEVRLVDGRRYTAASQLALAGAALQLTAAEGQVPTLTDRLRIVATEPSRVTLVGLVLSRGVETVGPVHLSLVACTLAGDAGEPSVSLRGDAAVPGSLRMVRCHAGALRLSGALDALVVDSSVVNGELVVTGDHVESVTLADSTVIGTARVARLDQAVSCVFTETVAADETAERAFRWCLLATAPPAEHTEQCRVDAGVSTWVAGAGPDEGRLVGAPAWAASMGRDAKTPGVEGHASHLARSVSVQRLVRELVPEGGPEVDIRWQ